MKILIPVLGFGRAGGYRVLSQLANELIKLGHDVEFLCPDESDPPYYPTNARVSWVNEKGLRLTENNESIKKTGAFAIQTKLTRALKRIPKNSYDIIIANHSLTTLPVIIAGLKDKTLYYVQAYEPEFYNLSGGVKNKILSYLSGLSYKMNLFTIVNGKTYLNYKKLRATKILYPGIDFNLFYPGNIAPKKSTETIIIGTIGRLESFKGTRYVIDAYKILKKKYSNVQLYVGFGNPDDFLNEEGISCFQPHGDKELGKFYRSLDYYLCGANVQLGAFHYPVAEAMCSGVSVITTQYYPANEANAWIVEPFSSGEFIKAFELAQDNYSLRKKKIQQGLEDTRQFDWQLVGKRLDEYMIEFIGN